MQREAKITQITGKELIADILAVLPEASEVLASYGILCAGCAINQYETLEDGIKGHGISQERFEEILQDLNDLPSENQTHFEITPKAVEKIKAFQKELQAEDKSLHIQREEREGKPTFSLHFKSRPDAGEYVYNVAGITIFCTPQTYRNLRNYLLDYHEDKEKKGFKFTKKST